MNIVATYSALDDFTDSDTRRQYNGWYGKSLVKLFRFHDPSETPFRNFH